MDKFFLHFLQISMRNLYIMDDSFTLLYYRQRCSIDFLIEVESEDIRHSGDEIEHRHDARFEVRRVNLVLTADPAQ